MRKPNTTAVSARAASGAARAAAVPTRAASGPARSAGVGIPWLGLLVLVASILLAGRLLSGLTPADIFQTWYLSRAAGLVSLILLWASVALGLMQANGFLRGLTSSASNTDVHAFTALLMVYAVTFHAWILLWDQYQPFTWVQVVVPFAANYKPLVMGLGSIGFYVALGAVMITYVRGWLGSGAWRALHRASVVGFGLALVHGYLAGPDTALPAVQFFYYFAGASVTLLLAFRLLGGRNKVARPAR